MSSSARLNPAEHQYSLKKKKKKTYTLQFWAILQSHPLIKDYTQ